jgi:hypothetical protein
MEVVGPHVTEAQWSRLREGTLPPRELASIGAHAVGCEACSRILGEVRSLGRMARDVRAQFDAEPEDLSGDELEELREFRRAMQPRRRRWIPYAIAASIAGIAVAIAVTVPRLDRDPVVPAPPPRHTVVVPPKPSPAPVAKPERRPEWAAWVADVQARRALPIPAVLASLRAGKTRLRGEGDEDDLRLSPDRAVVTTTRPPFQWSAREGTHYRVILRNGDAIVESGDLSEPHWTPPRDLPRGREYQWQVELTLGDVRSIYPKAPEPPARFRVLEQRALDEIEEARTRHPDDALLQAVILAHHGLRTETLATLDRLERQDAALAADLRASLRRWPR